MTATTVLERHARTFRAVAATVVPEMATLDEAGWAHVKQTVTRAVALRPPRMHRQLALLLGLIERLPLLRYGRSFSGLAAADQTAFLDALQHAPVTLLRRGVWGVRTLVFMGYYTHPDVQRDIGYHADARGWQVRPARTDHETAGPPS